jgi:hypothetical protein
MSERHAGGPGEDMKCRWPGVGLARTMPVPFVLFAHGQENRVTDTNVDWHWQLVCVHCNSCNAAASIGLHTLLSWSRGAPRILLNQRIQCRASPAGGPDRIGTVSCARFNGGTQSD